MTQLFKVYSGKYFGSGANVYLFLCGSLRRENKFFFLRMYPQTKVINNLSRKLY